MWSRCGLIGCESPPARPPQAYDQLRADPVLVPGPEPSQVLLLLVGGPPVSDEEERLLRGLRYRHVYLEDEVSG